MLVAKSLNGSPIATGDTLLSRSRMVVVSPGPTRQLILGRRFGPGLLRVYGALLAVHHVVVDPILDVGRNIRRPKDPLVVGFVLSE